MSQMFLLLIMAACAQDVAAGSNAVGVEPNAFLAKRSPNATDQLIMRRTEAEPHTDVPSHGGFVYLAVAGAGGLESICIGSCISIIFAGFSSIGYFFLVVGCQARQARIDTGKVALQSAPQPHPRVALQHSGVKPVMEKFDKLVGIIGYQGKPYPLLSGYTSDDENSVL